MLPLLLGLLGVFLLLYLSGFLVPERYDGTVVAELPLPPERVWTALADFERFPLTADQCRRVERTGGSAAQPSWIEHLGGGTVEVHTTESDPPRRAVRRARDKRVPVSIVQTLALEPAGTGTRLTVRHELAVRRGTWHVPLFRWALTLARGARGGARPFVSRLRRILPPLGVEELN